MALPSKCIYKRRLMNCRLSFLRMGTASPMAKPVAADTKSPTMLVPVGITMPIGKKRIGIQGSASAIGHTVGCPVAVGAHANATVDNHHDHTNNVHYASNTANNLRYDKLYDASDYVHDGSTDDEGPDLVDSSDDESCDDIPRMPCAPVRLQAHREKSMKAHNLYSACVARPAQLAELSLTRKPMMLCRWSGTGFAPCVAPMALSVSGTRPLLKSGLRPVLTPAVSARSQRRLGFRHRCRKEPRARQGRQAAFQGHNVRDEYGNWAIFAGDRSPPPWKPRGLPTPMASFPAMLLSRVMPSKPTHRLGSKAQRQG